MSNDASQTSKRYGLLQTILFCLFAVVYFVIEPRPLFHSPLLRVVGGILCAGGLLLLVAALIVIRRSIQIAPAPRDDAQLVTNGVYAWFRHPIYTGIVVVIAGLFLRQPTLAVGLVAALVIIYLAVKVRLEEKLLAARYPEYEAYRARTFGLVPWF